MRRSVGAALLGFLLTVVLALGYSLLSGSGSASSSAPETSSAPAPLSLDTTGFDPARIIDDSVFYDSTTMTQAQVESFIASVNKGCQTGTDGTACLASATFDTEDQAVSDACPGGYTGAAGESAAAIIDKVSQSCDINPQVLLVLIQKEQGLLTASGSTLSAADYEAAAGYACPDGGSCDPAHAGFFRQVWGAAWQFQSYRLNPAGFQVVAGVPTTIAYSPGSACGGAELTVANQATAGLYDYTPYQPNDAVASGGDDCSSWGNWNFYGYFRSLFGDPTPSTS